MLGVQVHAYLLGGLESDSTEQSGRAHQVLELVLTPVLEEVDRVRRLRLLDIETREAREVRLPLGFQEGDNDEAFARPSYEQPPA